MIHIHFNMGFNVKSALQDMDSMGHNAKNVQKDVLDAILKVEEKYAKLITIILKRLYASIKISNY